jgi:purine nucleosidase
MKMKNIVLDCDNTFGIVGCDVDDGLALLYLLGREDVNLVGITCTYGNSNVDTVYENTKTMMARLGCGLPVLKGSASPGPGGSAAADFLLQEAQKHRGDLCLLATGSLTNLRHAYEQDRRFFKKISETALMGGVTRPLCMEGCDVDELNFSSDPAAALCVLQNAPNLQIATGNNCLPAFFSREVYERRLKKSLLPIARYIYDKTAYWYEHMACRGADGFYNWDVVAAAALTEKELFWERETLITPTAASLAQGNLLGGGEKITVNLPVIQNPEVFEQHVYETYLKVEMKEDVKNENSKTV